MAQRRQAQAAATGRPPDRHRTAGATIRPAAAEPPAEARSNGERSDAEDEDAPRCGQAVQGHRHGQDPRRKANRAHLLEKKPTQRTRRLGRRAEVTGGDKKHVERLLGR